eukprot:Nitzschia sp. Nitz4//scaffold72_size95085//27259//28863//NITZ4_004750-RA/size95085-snap-gene-0.115-mRNA-1//1//CDS//3329557345//3001//frame0
MNASSTLTMANQGNLHGASLPRASRHATVPLVPPKGKEHVPLQLGLSEIVSIELGSDGKKKAKTSSTKTVVTPPIESAARQEQEKKSGEVVPMSAPSSACAAASSPSPAASHPTSLPSSLLANPLFLANPWQADMSALTMLAAAQQQQQEDLQLPVALQMEQLRRLRAAMLLQQACPTPTESLIASLGASVSPFLGTYLGNPSSRLFPSSFGSTSPASLAATAASSSLLGSSLSSGMATPTKRSSEGEDCIKKSVDTLAEYQHLSKKARKTPQDSAKDPKNETTALESSSTPQQDQTCNHSSGDDLSDEDGTERGTSHRFRPYQYEQWTEKFQELCEYRRAEGHCQVPHTYMENPPLARWVKRQRYQYKLKMEGKTSTMTDERIVLLGNIGFIWDSHAAAWAEKLQELKAYVKRYGDCSVPSTFPENPQLATWVKCQRRQYKLLRDNKTSNMTPERIVELEKIGFVWEIRKAWDSPYDHVPTTARNEATAAVR